MKESNEKPTLTQWKELYDAAMRIRRLAPWGFLWDTELVVLNLPGREEPVYCSVMGRNKECYAIGVYPGYQSVDSFYRMAESSANKMPLNAGLGQESLMCHFGDREEVEQEDRDIYKALGLRFRGRNEWIYFRTMEPGFYPWPIRAWEADLLIQVLDNLDHLLLYFVRENVQVDFENGETLLRSYSQEEGAWRNEVIAMPPRLLITPMMIVGNDLLIAKLKKCKRNGACLEFDVSYLPVPVRENKDDRPYFPRIALVMDRNANLLIDQFTASIDDPIETAVLEMLKRYIIDYGRPMSINVRDDLSTRYIGDFCQKLGITLIEGEGIPAIDSLLEGLLSSL